MGYQFIDYGIQTAVFRALSNKMARFIHKECPLCVHWCSKGIVKSAFIWLVSQKAIPLHRNPNGGDSEKLREERKAERSKNRVGRINY